MNMRFVDTTIWDKGWFFALPTEYKLFWKFLCDRANNAGIWEVNWHLTNMYLGTKAPLDPERFGNRDDGHARVLILKSDKWWIPGMILFQQRVDCITKLNPSNGYHKQVIGILKKEGIDYTSPYSTPTMPLRASFDHPPVPPLRGLGIGESIGLGIDKDRGCGGKEKTGAPRKDPEPPGFAPAWAEYPRKDGRKEALRYYIATVKNSTDEINLRRAIHNYNRHIAVNQIEPRYIKSGKTFFNNWQDWVEYKDTKPAELDEEE